MTRWIIGSSLQLRLLVVGVAAVVMFLGINQLRDIPLDLYPEFSPPYVEVQTEALGLSAEEVEQLITVPLEADLLDRVAFLKEIRSESIPGLSSVMLTFEPGTDLFRARQLVQEQLTQAHALPNVSKPPTMLQPLSSTSRVLKVGLRSDKLSLIQMSVLARWTMKPRLMGVPGVANVSIWGQRQRQLQVQVDPEHLRDQNVTLHQVIETTGNALWVSPLSFLEASVPGSGGFIDTPNQRLGVRHVLPISSPEDLAQVAVVETEGLTLGDVATIVENHQPLIGDALIGDEPGLMLVIEKFPWANTIDVTKGVEKALVNLAPAVAGIEFDTQIYRPATFIELALANFRTVVLMAAGLVALALLAFLFHWRSALVSLVAISASITGAAFVLHLRGVPFDTMVIAGLIVALAAIIDDAIIDIENVLRRLRAREEGQSASATIVQAAAAMRGPAAFGAVIMAVAAVPAFIMQDVAGAIFGSIAMSYLVAVAVSMLIALTLTPALAALLLRGTPPSSGGSPLADGLARLHESILAPVLRTPALGLAGIAALLVVGLASMSALQTDTSVPTFRERDFLIRLEAAPGTSHPAMTRIAKDAGRALRAIPGVNNVGSHVGRAVMSDEVSNVNTSEVWVSMDPTADYDATMAAVQETMAGFAGVSGEIMTYPLERIRDAEKDSEYDVVVRVYGQDWDVLHEKAEEIRAVVGRVEGVSNAVVERLVTEPIVEIEVDLARADQYGIKPGDVRRAASALLSGIEVGSLFEDQKVFEVVVWGTPENRSSVTDVEELLIDGPNGGHVRLKDVAHVRIAPSAVSIEHEAVLRTIDVGATVTGRSVADVADDIEERLRVIHFPAEHHAEVPPQYIERAEGRERVVTFTIASAIAIFLLLQAALGSWRLAISTTLTLPLALAGGLAAALLMGGTLSLGSFLGLLAVGALAVRNAIGLIHHCQRLEQSGEQFGPELVQRAVRERFAPMVAAAVVTAAAFLPVALLGNIAGQEVVFPMAVVVLGGLVTATILNLIITPSLFLRLGEGSAPEWEGEPGLDDETSSSEPGQRPAVRRVYG